MNSPGNRPAHLPDVAATDRARIHTTLDWVGMSELAIPFRLLDEEQGAVECQGYAQAYVNISRPDVKGIHMSRLYLLLESFVENELVTPATLEHFLRAKLETHLDISDSAALALRCDYYTRRAALKSEHRGWKSYPLEIVSTLKDGQHITELKLSVPYSSTCPCSASLSRQLLAEAMLNDFEERETLTKEELRHWLLSERGSVATPHSQRSWAYLRLRLAALNSFPVSELIDCVEQALKTPVQTAVKRQDEQEFARLNGQNLMFCEDAARRIKQALNEIGLVHDFWLKVEHQESLHAHNAVAIATKGIEGGYVAQLAC